MRIIRSIIFSFFSFLAVLIYSKIIFKVQSYNFLLILLFLFLCYFFYKEDNICDKKTKRYSLTISLILSLILSIGSIVSGYIYTTAVNIFVFKNIIYTLISTLGFTLFFYKLFKILFIKAKDIKIFENHNKMKFRWFILIFTIIFVFYILYFLRFYPAIMTTDSYYVLHYANNFILSDFHPFGHTWFVGIFFHLGKLLFSNLNMALAFSIIVQMILMVLMFSYTIKYLYDKGLNKKLTYLLVLIYALNPLFAYYSVTLWRDVMFGGAFIILVICLYEFVLEKNIKKRYIVLFIISTLVLLFFRNNGIYVFIIMIPFIILILRNKRLLMSVICGLLLLFYFIVKGPVFNYFNIQKTTSVEALSIPLQQIARVVASDRKIDDENLSYLKELFVYDKVKTSYSPVISDPIKNITSNNVLKDKDKFFKTYLSLFVKYPNVYVESYFLQTLGYWYPDVIYWATGGESSSIFKEENVYSNPLTPDWYNEVIDSTTIRSLPLNNVIWSLGLQFIILLFASFLMFYLNRKKFILCFIPLFALWVSIMIATPVFAELRYIFGLFVCSPIVLILARGINKE